MQKKRIVKDFDFYIDEYMYCCRSKRLRPKTMQSYEQTLRLFERWCLEAEDIREPGEVNEQVIRRYICSLQDRGKYTFYADESQMSTNNPDRRRDFRKNISVITINNYIRNLRAFFTWYADELRINNPMDRIRQLPCERKPQEFLEDAEIDKLLKSYDLSYFSEHRDYAIVMLLLDTGMRLGECLKITTEDLDMQERTIVLPAENTKGRRTRTVFFSVKMARTLGRWMRFKDRYTESALLFPVKAGTPMEVRSFEGSFRKHLRRTGIEKHFSPTCAAQQLRQEVLAVGDGHLHPQPNPRPQQCYSH